MFIAPEISFSQENDDMYFTSKDRIKKKVTKKVTPADVILSNTERVKHVLILQRQLMHP